MDELKTSFPDADYLKSLANHLERRMLAEFSDLQKIMVFGNAAMNWLPDLMSDTIVQWRREKVPVNNIVLTGTNPTWNAIIIEKCHRSAVEFKQYLQDHPESRDLFKDAVFDPLPILLRQEKDQTLRVLDGMHRFIAALRDNLESIDAYIGQLAVDPKPQCEPHLVYDLLRAYHRGINKDRLSLITALKFLRKAYANVDNLLRYRFTYLWVPSEELQKVIAEALQD